MSDFIRQYLVDLFQGVPISVYLVLLLALLIGVVIILSIKGFRGGCRVIAGLLLSVYILLVYCSTVFYRPGPSENNEYGFRPFGNYKAILDGRTNLIPESVMNVLVFIPIGILVKIAFCKMGIKNVLIIGMCLSLSIEIMQFIFDRGCSDVGDVINNTIGCLLGFGIYKLVELAFNKERQHS